MATEKHLVVLTGAGISAESGLKTFRDGDGLWEGHDVTQVATPEAWRRDPELVLKFYNMRRRDVSAAKPNAAHIGLADLEREFQVTIITQNIDDLHERAGSSRVLHLHGEIFKMRSELDEDSWYDIRDDMQPGALAPDGSLLRPAIVWFGEPVPMIEKAIHQARQADLFAIVGTSLVVYPAASLLDFVDDQVPKFIVDKRIPHTGSASNLTAIEAPATKGVELLKKMLRERIT